MSNSDREKWDAKYTRLSAGVEPADDWLKECVTGLPPGRALDLACGTGRNAIWLAQSGWQVDAIDISPVGLRHAREAARQAGAGPIGWIAADLDEYQPAEAAYDLIVVFRFLERERLPGQIVAALKPGGRLVYETFLKAGSAAAGNHVTNPAFVLNPGELPRLYSPLRVIEYREQTLDDRVVARFSAEKVLDGANSHKSDEKRDS